MDTFPNRSTRLVLLLAAGLVPCLLPAAGVRFAEELFPELQGLLETAATESVEIRMGALRIEEREGEQDVARGQRLPRAHATGRVLGAYEMRSDIEDNLRGDLNASVTVTQPLYQWGALERRETIAGHRVDLEELDVERSGTEHFMQLRRAYLQWILMRERKTVLEQTIRLSESFVEARRQLLDAGLSSEQEVLEMEARLMENRESLAFVQKSIADLESSFTRLAGPSVRVSDLEGAPLSVIEPMSTEEFEQLEASARGAKEEANDPLTKRWELMETIEDEQLAILDKRNWPVFDLVAGIYSDQIDSINQEDSVTRMRYFTGLQVTWNIFDGWQTDGYKRTSLARKRAYALMKEKTGSDVSRRIEALLAELELNLKQIEARSKREMLLERRVSLLREQVQQNRVSGVDLVEGEINYLEVQNRLMEARVNYLMNLMELGVLMGEDPALVHYREQT